MDFQNEMKESLPRHQFHHLNRPRVKELHEIIRNQNKDISSEIVDDDVITISDDSCDITDDNCVGEINESIRNCNIDADFDDHLCGIGEDTLSEINVNDFIAFLINDSSSKRLNNFIVQLTQLDRGHPVVESWASHLAKKVFSLKIKNGELDSFFTNIIRIFSESFPKAAIDEIYIDLIEKDCINNVDTFLSNASDSVQLEFFQRFLARIRALKEGHLKLVITLLQTNNQCNCKDVVTVSKLIKLMEDACHNIPADNELFGNILMVIIQHLNSDMIDIFDRIEKLLKSNTSRFQKIAFKLLTTRKNKLLSK